MEAPRITLRGGEDGDKVPAAEKGGEDCRVRIFYDLIRVNRQMKDSPFKIEN